MDKIIFFRHDCIKIDFFSVQAVELVKFYNPVEKSLYSTLISLVQFTWKEMPGEKINFHLRHPAEYQYPPTHSKCH